MPEPTPNQKILLELEFVPIEEEIYDSITIGTVDDVLDEVRSELTNLEGYTVASSPAGTRGGDIIQLLAQNVIEHQDFIKYLVGAAGTALGLLANQSRIKNLEITLKDGQIIKLEDASPASVKSILDQLQAQPSGEEVPLKLKASVSKNAKSKKK
jgi:hypothetical protein